ncbi:hypothetical protein PFISCL1PPCAC_11608 [Pristionchus fissidentatus]|uniref:Uncharacterized protein n=1 Tax=Pristionchus fissidentatus TaxID=1538716 RepID=A0AAV5VL07_9BILA|nr:hypothetical protein PFISCL1PPCAC_11608 [Pristionchus fissidentatus]
MTTRSGASTNSRRRTRTATRPRSRRTVAKTGRGSEPRRTRTRPSEHCQPSSFSHTTSDQMCRERIPCGRSVRWRRNWAGCGRRFRTRRDRTTRGGRTKTRTDTQRRCASTSSERAWTGIWTTRRMISVWELASVTEKREYGSGRLSIDDVNRRSHPHPPPPLSPPSSPVLYSHRLALNTHPHIITVSITVLLYSISNSLSLCLSCGCACV